MDHALIWFIIIATGVLIYVVLDGLDLGLGILFPSVGKHEERGVILQSVAPIWDGNETWLVVRLLTTSGATTGQPMPLV